MFVHPDGASTTVPVTIQAKNVRLGPTQVWSADPWELIYPPLKARKKTSIFSTGTMVIRRGLVWMILPLKEYSLGWMGVLLNSTTGRRINQTTSEKKIVFTLLDQGMGTCGMMWIVLLATNTLARKVTKTVFLARVTVEYIVFRSTSTGKFNTICINGRVAYRMAFCLKTVFFS